MRLNGSKGILDVLGMGQRAQYGSKIEVIRPRSSQLESRRPRVDTTVVQIHRQCQHGRRKIQLESSSGLQIAERLTYIRQMANGKEIRGGRRFSGRIDGIRLVGARF